MNYKWIKNDFMKAMQFHYI